MADKFTESLFQAVHDSVQRARDELGNLGDAPARFQESVEEYWTIAWDALSQQGRLPVPSIPNPLSKSAAPPAPPPSFWQRSASRLQQHKYLAGGLGLALTAVPAYLVYQRFYAGPPLHRPEDTPRPFSIGSTRSEAVLILGADPGSPGCALARDLTRRGFVVFVTVSEESDVPQLERDVGGWLKAIVLNPTDAESIPIFSQTFSSALSMRFPLRSAGDPFVNSSGGHARSLLLSGVINCLPLTAHFEPCPPIPLEATSLSTFSNTLIGTLATTLGVLQAVLPLLRNATTVGSPALHGTVPPAVILTLTPASTSNLALPFVGGQSSADVALSSMMEALRREIRAAQICSKATSGPVPRRIKFSAIEVGFFEPETHHQRPVELGVSAEDVPPHLAFYLPAMARRTLASRNHGSHYVKERALSPVTALGDQVTQAIIAPSRWRRTSRTSVGSGALTYRLASKLPTSWVDAYFTAQDYIASFLPAPKLLSSSSIRQHASRRTILRKPLPVVPVPGRHTATPTSMPHSLKSAYTTSEERSSESEGALSDPEHTGSQPITSSVASLASLPSEGESSRASESPVLGQSEYVQL